MKTLILTLSALLSLNSVYAAFLGPCAPTVNAEVMHLNCPDGQGSVRIQITTLMSPELPECQGDNHIEQHTAYFERTNGSSEEINDGDFTFNLGQSGLDNGTFDSDSRGYHFKGCITPIHGAASFGN